ncbi:hypothetical protein SACS_1498 [Parasaccharibacter apium]|uniref:Uncharacterized protein n=1 Tax=Parasaccharibacter apium TaxID=1510841 RepID=A0A7U7J1K4_9PROT|nr:hypothetical protein SACS_1498 [Parasaccharibacter apium]
MVNGCLLQGSRFLFPQLFCRERGTWDGMTVSPCSCRVYK